MRRVKRRHVLSMAVMAVCLPGVVTAASGASERPAPEGALPSHRGPLPGAPPVSEEEIPYEEPVYLGDDLVDFGSAGYDPDADPNDPPFEEAYYWWGPDGKPAPIPPAPEPPEQP